MTLFYLQLTLTNKREQAKHEKEGKFIAVFQIKNPIEIVKHPRCNFI